MTGTPPQSHRNSRLYGTHTLSQSALLYLHYSPGNNHGDRIAGHYIGIMELKISLAWELISPPKKNLSVSMLLQHSAIYNQLPKLKVQEYSKSNFSTVFVDHHLEQNVIQIFRNSLHVFIAQATVVTVLYLFDSTSALSHLTTEVYRSQPQTEGFFHFCDGFS